MALGLFQKPSWPNEISRPWFRVTAYLQWVDDFPASGEDAWFARLEEAATPEKLIDRGEIEVTGDAAGATWLMDCSTGMCPEKAVAVRRRRFPHSVEALWALSGSNPPKCSQAKF